MPMSFEDLQELRGAKQILENPGLAAKVVHLLGKPVEKGIELLPQRLRQVVTEATQKSLHAALTVALHTMGTPRNRNSGDFLHKIAAVATGAGGGAFGLPALVVELPLSTTIMLRSIADIARSHGEDLKETRSQLACLEVFALGGRAPHDDASETGYFAVRAALAKAISEAAQYIAERGIAKEGAPPFVRLVIQIAERFGIQVSEKVALQAVPVVGAAGGAIINLVFIDHFQNMARGHFTVRRLERTYGHEMVKYEYERLVL